MDMLIVLGGKQRLNQEFSTHQSCHSERERKNFPKKKKTRKLNITELTLQETLKRVFQAEIKEY